MEELPYNKKRHASLVLQELSESRNTGKDCDFVIKVGTKEIYVHRNILRANSRYFRGALAHDTVENQTGCVELKDLDAKCVKKCIDFMYGRKIMISRKKWKRLLNAAERLDIPMLREVLADYIGMKLTAESFYDIKHLSDLFQCQDLGKKCDDFALKNFEVISELDGFKRITADYIFFLLESPDNESSGIRKMKSLLDWIKFDRTNRIELLPSILSEFNLSQVPLEHRRHLLANEPLFSECFDCYKIMSSSLIDDIGPSLIVLDVVSGETSTLGAKMGLGDRTKTIAVFDHDSKHLQCFDPRRNTWKKKHLLLDDMTDDYFTTIALHQFIYVLTGLGALHRIKYTDATATWERLSNMMQYNGLTMDPPIEFVTDGHCLYAIGSVEDSNPIEMFQPTVKKWFKLTEAFLAENIVCVYLKQNIYCIGGRWSDAPLRAVERFHLTSNSWETIASLNDGRYSASACTYDDGIIVIGGLSDGCFMSSVESYDVKTNIWTRLSPLMDGGGYFRSFVIGKSIFAVGGCIPQVRKYSTEEDKWQMIDIPVDMNLGIFPSAVAVSMYW